MFARIQRQSAPRRARLVLAPAAVVAATLTLVACSNSNPSSGGGATSGGGGATVTKTVTGSTGAAASSSTPAAATSSSAAPKTVVSITTLNSDGAEYGVGMPVIAFFSRKPVSAKAWQADTKVTANGKTLKAAWYFEPSSASKKFPYEAHLRPGPRNYWPAHSHIHVQFPAKGTSLGGNLVSDGKLTSLDFSIGAEHIGLVNNATHTITITSDGKQVYKFPVSLGASNTPTARGVKVIMEKGVSICMTGPGYHECGVKYTQRLTYGGEYLHAAPWNTTNIRNGVNSSNGCTNLYTDDAKTLYDYLRVGDVVSYPNANGPAMSLGAGYGDWNISWSQWLTGGAVSTTT